MSRLTEEHKVTETPKQEQNHLHQGNTPLECRVCHGFKEKHPLDTTTVKTTRNTIHQGNYQQRSTYWEKKLQKHPPSLKSDSHTTKEELQELNCRLQM